MDNNYPTYNNYPNSNNYPIQHPPIWEETIEQKQQRAYLFKKLFPATLMLAIVFVLCLYRNANGITMPFFTLTVVGYCFYVTKVYQYKLKKMSYFMAAVIILLGISCCITNNGFIIFCNYVGILLMIEMLLIHNFYEDKHWNISKYVSAFIITNIMSVATLPDPFGDASRYFKLTDKKRSTKLLFVLIGLVIAIPLLLVITVLLAQADYVFGKAVSHIFHYFDSFNIVGIAVFFCFGFMAAYLFTRTVGKHEVSNEVVDNRRFDPIIAITVLSLISLVYVFFCGIQVLYLFSHQLELPNGYTYSEYAHEGFFQLLFVCVLNLALVLFTSAFFRENLLQKILLVVISACTYVMLVSSAFRMCLYVSAYGLTFLRVLVLWFLLVLALFFAGVIVQIVKADFPLFRYGLAVVSCCYLVLAFAKPDYWIARYNTSIDTYIEHTSREDYSYDYSNLRSLSSDAAPILIPKGYSYDYVTNDSFREFNFSRAAAYKLNREYFFKK